MPRALVALGANLGDREHTLARAVKLLRAHPRISHLLASAWHETAPVGGPGHQENFLNGAVSFETSLGAEPLARALAEIEHTFGRKRGIRWQSRAIDLDLLLYGNEVISSPGLVVPHPRMAFRRFVLEPAAQVAANMPHPTIGWTVGQLLAHLDFAANYVALMGLPGSGKTALSRRLSDALGSRSIEIPPDVTDRAPPADPSGPVFGRRIQFLDCFTCLLAGLQGAGQNPLATSDFFFDQCLAYARCELDEAAYQEYRAAWSERVSHLVAPKLLVVLDTPSAVESPNPDPRAARLRQELFAIAGRKGLGPVLYAGRENPELQFDEVSAAITAMQ